MSTVHLVTFQILPDGEPGGDLIAPLRERGVDARWVSWDDPDVVWDEADLVVVRSAWDYHRRLDEFLAWAHKAEQSAPLLNGADLFTWNSDKTYLRELAEYVPTVPTELLDDNMLVRGVADALTQWGAAVVKPRVGVGGQGVVVLDEPYDRRLEFLSPAPWIIQPLVESVRSDGERSVYVFGGRAVSQVDKLPADGEIRVHEEHGGSSRSASLDPRLAMLATSAVEAACAITGITPAYARVDAMRWEDRWVVSELELIEPGLYLDVDAANADRFAEMILRSLRSHG